MSADRQDIDALLIGALYGELDGDERARLDAHLVNHPQDRSALEGLRSTRAMLRDADVAAYLGSAEPAPAISAKLIQEAARRAPAPAGGGAWAWLSSLFRPFVASPALAAATALVLVGGAAGVMYARGTFESTEPRAERSGNVATLDEGKVDPALAPAAAGAAPTAGAPMDDYRVGLEEGQAAGTAAAAPTALDGLADSTGDGKDQVATERDQRRNDELAFQAEAPSRASKKGTGSATSGTKRAPGYIALDPVKKDAPSPLTADGDELRQENEQAKNIATDKAVGSSRGAGGGGTTFESALGEGRTPDVAAPAPAPPATAPKPAAIARDAGKTGTTANPAQAAALETWARDQHARMVSLVKKGQCTDAGAIGANIMRRAPDYYAANVANDRQVRSCRSYVDRARRAKSEDTKSKAAAPRSPAPESQVDMEDAAH